MLITYICPVCNKKRFFSNVKKDKVFCQKCNSEMQMLKGNVVSEVMTTPEARYLGDEALFNTVADRISNKHRTKHL